MSELIRTTPQNSGEWINQMTTSEHTDLKATGAGNSYADFDCSVFQRQIIRLIAEQSLNGSMSLTEIAMRIKSNRLACSSALRSLEAKGLAGNFRHGRDQWSQQMWFIKKQNAKNEGMDAPEGDS